MIYMMTKRKIVFQANLQEPNSAIKVTDLNEEKRHIYLVINEENKLLLQRIMITEKINVKQKKFGRYLQICSQIMSQVLKSFILVKEYVRCQKAGLINLVLSFTLSKKQGFIALKKLAISCSLIKELQSNYLRKQPAFSR